MAKSLRSKWRRKMKQDKRVRYGKKELDHLKTIVEKAKENDAGISTDVNMDDQLYTVVAEPRASRKTKDDEPATEEEAMETNKIRIFDPKTLRDQHGSYPVWMSKHKMEKIKKNTKRLNKQKKKEQKKSKRNNKK